MGTLRKLALFMYTVLPDATDSIHRHAVTQGMHCSSSAYSQSHSSALHGHGRIGEHALESGFKP